MRPKGTQAELEGRRLTAIRMLEERMTVNEVGREIGADQRSIRRWKALAIQSGPAALHAKPTSGRPRKLTAEQHALLKEILRRGARAAGFLTDQWTCARVAQWIETYFGVHYHVDHVGRLLRAWGWSARQQNHRFDGPSQFLGADRL